MPIQVDLEARRAQIAEATVRTAAGAGLQAVTIRSVAAQLGASTTFITNYLPTRSALLVNALRHTEEEWLEELRSELAAADPADALRRAMRSAVRWDEEELLRSHFWVAVLAVPQRDSDVDRYLADATTAVRAVFAKLVDQCGHPDPDGAADLLVTITQGAFVSIVETPELWNNDRLQAVADRAVDAVLAATAFGPA